MKALRAVYLFVDALQHLRMSCCTEMYRHVLDAAKPVRYTAKICKSLCYMLK